MQVIAQQDTHVKDQHAVFSGLHGVGQPNRLGPVYSQGKWLFCGANDRVARFVGDSQAHRDHAIQQAAQVDIEAAIGRDRHLKPSATSLALKDELGRLYILIQTADGEGCFCVVVPVDRGQAQLHRCRFACVSGRVQRETEGADLRDVARGIDLTDLKTVLAFRCGRCHTQPWAAVVGAVLHQRARLRLDREGGVVGDAVGCIAARVTDKTHDGRSGRGGVHREGQGAGDAFIASGITQHGAVSVLRLSQVSQREGHALNQVIRSQCALDRAKHLFNIHFLEQQDIAHGCACCQADLELDRGLGSQVVGVGSREADHSGVVRVRQIDDGLTHGAVKLEGERG